MLINYSRKKETREQLKDLMPPVHRGNFQESLPLEQKTGLLCKRKN